jgi:hypothetical protein
MVTIAKTLPDNPKEGTQESSFSKFFSQARNLMKSISWLSPHSSLFETTSTEFGRNIEISLNSLSQHNGVVSLRLRKRSKAVVMSIQHYEQILALKDTYERLLEIQSERTISDAIDDFDALYDRIASPESLKAADALFSANAADLREAYRPGETEAS